jgi:homocysteine S-methyltransferase
LNPIKDILDRFQAMTLDGGFATELEKRNCDLNDTLWSARVLMEEPDLIALVHQDYLKAGADCIISASYQATIEGFKTRGLNDEEALRIIRLSVEIAKSTRDLFWENVADQGSRPRPLVAASVGPYGAYLADGSEYRGDYKINEEQLIDFHRRRLQTLISTEPDLLAFETIPCLDEAKALTRLLTEHPSLYGWVSFTAKDGLHICNGERISDCAHWLNDYDQVAAIGVNCTAPQHVSSLVGEIKRSTDKPVIVYPNAGEEYDPVEKQWSSGTCSDFSTFAQGWSDDGVRIIGGCCRTGPEDIERISSWIR